jgi:diguanylate cyclase (GGDEF)-like protein
MAIAGLKPGAHVADNRRALEERVTTGEPEGEGGPFSFEERLTAEIESLISGLDERALACESLSGAAKSMETALEAANARIAELEGLLEEARALSQAALATDALTGLAARQDILKSIKQEKNRTDRAVPQGEAGFSLVLFDLDGFKDVNEAYGQAVGDKVLKRFTAFLKSSIRSYDSIGRYGADEFLVLLPGASKDQALRVVAEASRKIEAWTGLAKEAERAMKGKGPASLSCCAGLTDYRSEGKAAVKDAEALAAQAEYALYRAKRAGKGGYAVWGDAKGKAHA